MKQQILNKNCLVGLKDMSPDSIHLTCTSPPYYNAKAYSTWETYEDYLSFLKDVFTFEFVHI